MQGRAGEGPATFSFPSDPRDGWEPGAPSIRAMAPSAVGGAVVPLAVYYLVRHRVGGDAPALAIAGIPAALWVLLVWCRRRTLDPIGLLTMVSFAVGLTVSFALGGSALVLKVRDSAVTSTFGLFCLASLWVGRRPLMFFVGRAMSAGGDPLRRGLYDDLWGLPPVRVVFRIITAAWGVGLIAEVAIRVTLALLLPTGPFLAVSPVLAGTVVGGLFAFTVWFSRWARGRASSASVPEDGGSAWWWLRSWLRPAPRDATAY